MATKISFIFIGFTLLLFGTTAGQNRAKIDSLKRVLATAQSDTLKATLLARLSNQYETFAPDTAVRYAKQSLTIAQKTGEKSCIAYALLRLGLAFEANADYSQALDCFRQSSKLSKELGRHRWLATALTSIGGVYAEQGEYNKAFDYFLQSRKLYETLGDKRWESVMLYNIGNVYSWQSDYAMALDYFKKSLKLGEEARVAPAEFAATLSAIGSNYLFRKT